MNCSRCGLPVSWALRMFGGCVVHATVLYAYAKLLLADARYARPNVWGCDRCKVAGVIPEGDTHE